MTLPNEEVLQLLQDEFILGSRNIERDEHVGLSHGYRKTDSAVGTTNGAGGRNVQLCVLASDRTVLHVLPGFWHAEDLVDELKFALTLHELYDDQERSKGEKQSMFQAMHRAKVRRLSPATIRRSRWQGFDVWEEVKRNRKQRRDTLVLDENGQPMLSASGQIMAKPLCEVVHERMAKRPFMAFEDFDMEAFVDYGRAYYDNNPGSDRGKAFHAAARSNKKRLAAQKKERERQKKEAERKKRRAKGSSAYPRVYRRWGS
ncbi:MAG: hypothetical protein NXI31_07925 [bacterium]|nr:hypothetical protein [bacterium]